MAFDLTGLSPEQREALLNQAALQPPPSHVTVSLDHPPNGDVLTRAVVGAAIGLCTIFVLGRVMVAVKTPGRLVADWVLLLGFSAYVAYGALVLDSTERVRYLIHQWDLRLRDYLYITRNRVVGSNLFALSSVTIKTGILLEWLVIFNHSRERNTFFRTASIAIWLNVLFHIVTLVAFDAACRPFVKNWDPFVSGSCYDTRPIYVASTVWYLVVDLVILYLPQRTIWSLQLSTRKKQGVAFFFGFGILAIVSVIARLIISVQIYLSADLAYAYSSIGLFVIVEMSCGIIIYCAPSMPKAAELIRSKLCPKKMSDNGSNYNKPAISSSPPVFRRRNDDGRADGEELTLADYTNTPYQQGDGSVFSLKSRAERSSEYVGTGILRTAERTAVASPRLSPGRAEDDPLDRQHPWTSLP